nr:PREDICTED: CSC1-like protein 1 isoform X2 [Bemisia tabaci]
MVHTRIHASQILQKFHKPPKGVCFSYNLTTANILTTVYEGIPQNLFLNLIAFVLIILLFTLMRKKAWDYGRLSLVQNRQKREPSVFYDSTGDKLGDENFNNLAGNNDTKHSTLSVDAGVFSWCLATLLITDDNIFAKSGSDAVQYLLFQHYIIKFLAIITVVSMCLILPINFSGAFEGDERSFGHTTISNLSPKSPWIWVHVTIAILYLPLAIYILRKFSAHVPLADKGGVSRTLMIVNIPQRHCNHTNIQAYFREVYPQLSIQNIQFAYNIERIKHLERKLKKMFESKFYCDRHLRRTGERLQVRPHIISYLCTCCGACKCGKKFDAISYYTREIMNLRAELQAEHDASLKHPLGITFVTFGTAEEASKVYWNHRVFWPKFIIAKKSTVAKLLKPSKWVVTYAPPPGDICWENLSVSSKYKYLKASFTNAALFIVLFFLTTPVIILNTINILKLKIEDEIHRMSPMLSEFLPTILLLFLGALLPVVVVKSDRWLVHWTRSERNQSIMRKTFVFLLFAVLILPSLGLTSASALLEFAINKSNETYRWECLFLPDKGAFFVNYVITSAFIGNSLELIRLGELFIYVIRFSLTRSRAETESVRKFITWEFQFGVQYARMLIIFAVTVVYSLSCPLITPFGLVFMYLKYFVDRYNIYFVYGPSKISRQIHILAINCVMASVVFLQFSFLLLCILRRGLRDITIYSLIGFSITLSLVMVHCVLPWCEIQNPIYQWKKTASYEADCHENILPFYQSSLCSSSIYLLLEKDPNQYELYSYAWNVVSNPMLDPIPEEDVLGDPDTLCSPSDLDELISHIRKNPRCKNISGCQFPRMHVH